ncbi:hypothetical protein, partial [Klebsiella pneumoniae]|uniref:hypothetical protein n=1 Tax=Klebsiella pneumoniae TaxID=573 RepID=UPI003EDEC47B
MQDLGKAPTIVKADRPEYDASPINTLSAQAVARANQDRQQTEQDFGEEQKLTDLGQRRADQDVARQRMARENDPNSPESEQARNY